MLTLNACHATPRHTHTRTCTKPTPHRTAPDLFRALSEAIHIVARGAHDPLEAHARVRRFYDWTHVARRTEAVYEAVVRSEAVDFGTRVRRCVLPLSLPHLSSWLIRIVMGVAERWLWARSRG